jgi:hypothetical protein
MTSPTLTNLAALAPRLQGPPTRVRVAGVRSAAPSQVAVARRHVSRLTEPPLPLPS